MVDVANETGHPIGRPIQQIGSIASIGRTVGAREREDPEGSEIGTQHHVRLLDAHEAFDRRAVERYLAIEGLFELLKGDLHVLVHAKNVGELEPHETNPQRAGRLENLLLRPIRLGLVVHGSRRGGSRHNASPFGFGRKTAGFTLPNGRVHSA